MKAILIIVISIYFSLCPVHLFKTGMERSPFKVNRNIIFNRMDDPLYFSTHHGGELKTLNREDHGWTVQEGALRRHGMQDVAKEW